MCIHRYINVYLHTCSSNSFSAWKFTDTKITGGSAAPRDMIQTIGQCEKYCRRDQLCKGFDFDPSMRPVPCFIHRIDTICRPRIAGNGINHHRIRNVVCTGEPGQYKRDCVVVSLVLPSHPESDLVAWLRWQDIDK